MSVKVLFIFISVKTQLVKDTGINTTVDCQMYVFRLNRQKLKSTHTHTHLLPGFYIVQLLPIAA